jgi:hypothetical protein
LWLIFDLKIRQHLPENAYIFPVAAISEIRIVVFEVKRGTGNADAPMGRIDIPVTAQNHLWQ